jgi:molecular chaperone GrpE
MTKHNPQEKDPPSSCETKGNGEELSTPVFVTVSAEEMEKITGELASCKDKYLRSLAEMENMRKRLSKDKQESIQFCLQNLIVEFLNPIDQIENVLKFTQQMSDEVKHWVVGFQMILAQFKTVLTNNGVTAFDSVGTHFNPHAHEAVEMVSTTEQPPGVVVSESVRGYKMGDRIIRPARVTVAKSPDA